MKRLKHFIVTATAAGAVLVICLSGWGCRRDVRLAGKKVRSLQVRTVEHYGVVLNQDASPQEVAYVLLRAIRDDVNAASPAEREAALDVQFDVCHPGSISGSSRPGVKRDEVVHLVVTHWAPALAYYVDSFDFDPAEAKSRMTVSPTKVLGDGRRSCSVYLPVDDPNGDPKARVIAAVVLIRAKPGGGPSSGTDGDTGYWRVNRVGFRLGTRRAPSSAGSPPSTGRSG